MKLLCLISLLVISIAQARLFLPGVMNYFACDTIHRVSLGDSCSSISQKHGIKISLLLWKNKKLQCPPLVGQKLCVDNWI